jgi:hypothetical protein
MKLPLQSQPAHLLLLKLQQLLLNQRPQSPQLVDLALEIIRSPLLKAWERVQRVLRAPGTTPLHLLKEWEPVLLHQVQEVFRAPWLLAQVALLDQVAKAVKVAPADLVAQLVEDSNGLQEVAKEAVSVKVVPVQVAPLEPVAPRHVQDLDLTVHPRVAVAVVPVVEPLVLLVREAQRVNPESQKQPREQNLNYVKHPS